MSMALRTLDGVEVAGKRVSVRADLNVPLDGDVVREDARIRSTIPTLMELASKGATVVVLSRFGRPNGRVDVGPAAGGGDTLAALGAAGELDDFSCASTGGGAFLEGP